MALVEQVIDTRVLRATKFVINDGSTGATRSAGTANSKSKIFEYKVPGNMVLGLDDESTLDLKDNGATESANSSRVSIEAVEPEGQGRKIIAEANYLQVKANQDQALKFHIGGPWLLPKDTLLEIHITSNQAIVATTFDLVLSAKKITRI